VCTTFHIGLRLGTPGNRPVIAGRLLGNSL